MQKQAGLEDTTMTDPNTGLKIRVSTTTRKMYRYIFRGQEEEAMRNNQLNEFIANDFVKSSDKVVHHFRLGKGGDSERTKAEIRNKVGSTMFFISVERGSYIDILTIQSAWKSPKYTSTYGIRKNK